MEDLNDILHNSVQRAFFKSYLERLEELSEGTILGEIFETFSFSPAFTAAFDELGEVDIDDHLDDLESLLRENEIQLDLYDAKSELEYESEDVKEVHRYLFDYFNEDNHYRTTRLVNIENTKFTEFTVSDIQDMIEDYVGDLAEVAVAESLGENKHSSDEDDTLKEVWSNSIQNICEIECWDEPHDRICQVFEDLPLGILSDKSDFGDGDGDVDAFIADMLERFPNNFKLNANSVVSSRNGYELYKMRFFPNSEIPKHLVPLYSLRSDDEFYTRDWSNLPSNCRFCASYDTYLLLREQGIDAPLEYIYLDGSKDYVIENSESIVFISEQASAICHDISDFVSVLMPDFLSQDITSFKSKEILQANIQAPNSRLLCILSGVGFTIDLSSESTLSLLEIARPSDFHDARAIGDMLDEHLTDARDPREIDGLHLVYTGPIRLEIPNSIPLESSTAPSDIIRTVYLDDYLGSTDSFRLDSTMLEYLALAQENSGWLALDLEDSQCHAVLEAEIRFEGINGDPEYKNIVTKPTSNVSIVYYPASRKSHLVDEDRTPIEHEDYVRWSVVNYSTLNQESSKLYQESEYYSDAVNSDAPCMPYFGYRGKKLYKNSNFMAYAYIYMFLPQIFGRFGEHVQNDVLSQTIPLGSILNTYFKVFSKSSEPLPENPRQFLQFAREYTLAGFNPIMPPEASSFQVRGSHYNYPLFVGNYLRSLKAESLETYNSPIRFLYSFIDTYTKPIAILYNALQFATSPRANPELRTSKQNLTSNYPLKYSDGSWVSTYISSLEESQGSEFAKSSVLAVSNVTEATISQELDRFMQSAQVKEYFEIRTMLDAFNHIFDYRNEALVQLPKVNGIKFNIEDLFSVIDSSVGEYHRRSRYSSSVELADTRHPYLHHASDFKPKTVFDSEGEIVMSAFSQQFTASITFLSRFASFVIGTFITEDFENSRFFKLFLTGNSSERAAVKNTADFRGLLEFPIVTKKLAKIVKNPNVSSAAGNDRERVPFTVSNLSKNVVPLDVMRYMLSTHFSDMYTYVPMSIDEGVSIPKGKRMSLGAYCSIYLCLAGSKKAFLGLQSAEQYGAAQAVFEESEISFDTYGDEIYDFTDHEFVVRQATASGDDYSDSDGLSPASDADISSRFSNLTSAYQICIGQSGMSYIDEAKQENLEVFTFFKGDANISTLGFSFSGFGDNGAAQYSIEDSNGGSNNACYEHSTQGSLFILNWLADVFLTYTLDEDTLRSILNGDEFTYSPSAELDLEYHDIVEVFRAFDNEPVQAQAPDYDDSLVGLDLYDEIDGINDPTVQGNVSAIPRLAEIFENYSVSQVREAIPKLSELHSGSFFDILYRVYSDENTVLKEIHMDEPLTISTFKKALFRKVK